MTPTAAEVWRKYVTDGVPASGPNQPVKADIVAWGTSLETLLSGSPAGLAYATRDLLFADLAHAPRVSAIVYGDATSAFNGTYVKVGASGVGSWSRIGDLPNDVLRLTVTGGTANAIVATAPETPTAPGNKIYILTPAAANTDATTISVNGENAVAIKNTLGSQLAANSLVDGSPVIMLWSTDHYQIVVSLPVDATGVLNDVLDARDDAQEAADLAVTAAGSLIVNFETIAMARAFSIPSGVKYFRTAGRSRAGDGGAALYTKLTSTPSPVKGWHEHTADGAYWALSPLPVLRPEMFDNGDPSVSTDCGPAIRNCRDYIAALGGGIVDLGSKQNIYLVGTLRNGVIFEPVTKMTVQGFGTIKVANGVYAGGQMQAIWPTDFTTDRSDNFTLRDFTLDMNGQNNLSSGYTTQVGVGTGEDIVIDNVTFLNMPGSQGIVLGQHAEPPTVQGVRITNNVFKESGWNVNNTVNDHSSIYFVADNVVCTGNRLKNSGNPPAVTVAVTAGIEVHGTNIVVTNNTVDGYERHGNIAAEVGNAINIVYNNNVGRNLRQAVVIFSANPHVIDKVSISFNKFGLVAMDSGYAIDANLQMDGSATLGTLSVVGNDITDSEASATAASIYAGISVGYFQIMRVSGNILRNLSGPGIDIAPLNANSNLEITDNTVVDCGRTSNATYKKGIKVLQTSAPKSIKIGGNTIINTSTAYMSHGIHVQLTSVAGGKIYEDDVIINVTTPYSIGATGVTTGPGL